MRNSALRQSGFTLIELAIVLVVIGLLIGGVLVGRDLITAATIRSQIKEMQEVQTQIATFRGKYGCLPGDCPNATTFFGIADEKGNVILNGDADGLIRSTVGAPSGGYSPPYIPDECLQGGIANSELTQALLHLNNAKLGIFVSNGSSGALNVGWGPMQAINNGTGLLVTCLDSAIYNAKAFNRSFADTNVIVIGAWKNTNLTRLGYIVGSSSYGTNLPIGIPIDFAKAMDVKADDGLPASGSFGVVGAIGTNGSNPGTACLENSNTSYPATTASCTAVFGLKVGQ